MKAMSWTTAGSILSAAASSACCWIPLLMIGTGVSAVGAATFFEQFRPLFLLVAVVLLAVGFYLSYRKPRIACGLDGSCSSPNRRLRGANRAMLWLSAALVAAFAFFPEYVGSVVGGAGTPAGSQGNEVLILGVRGMTCTGCEATVERALAEVPGVVGVEASFQEERVVITIESSSAPSTATLAAALGSAGYELAPMANAMLPVEASVSGHWVAEVQLADGTNVGLVVDLDRLGTRWAGEFDVREFGVENYPVQITLSGRAVTLHFAGPDADFHGTLTADGTVLSGVVSFGDERILTELRRTGDPQFSETFRQLEAAVGDSTLVERLTDDGTELRRRFNADRDKVRLVMLLSPT